MKISYNLLQTYFKDFLPKPAELADLLTMHSFEIEGMTEHDGDTIFEMKTLANRAHDCLGHIGVTKEVSLLLNIRLERNPLLVSTNAWLPSEKVAVRVEDQKLCARYAGLVIEDVQVGASPEWLQKRLSALGQKSINNIVDATNIVMFEIGQPLHAFDMDKLTVKDGKVTIAVRMAQEGEKINTLGGGEHSLTKEILLITDGNSEVPISIAGIKGGVQAEITTETKNIFVESANFDPISIRKTAQKLGLRTDASVRFEHELSSELVYPALVAVAETILAVASSETTFVEGVIDIYTEPVERADVSVTLEEISALIGTSIPPSDAERILRSLSAGFEEKNGTYTVTPPFERLDLMIKEDLIEEVGRIYGYKQVEPKKLSHVENIPVNPRVLLATKIRNILTEAGYIEVFTYVFLDEGVVVLENPIAKDKKFLRKDLIAGLTSSLALNKINSPLLGFDTVRIFEIGNVFTKEGEKWRLGIGVKHATKKKENEAEVLHVAEKLLSEKLAVTVSGSIQKNVLEIDLDDLVQKVKYDADERLPKVASNKEIVYKKIFPYPFIARDVALFVSEKTKTEAVLEIIEREAGELLVVRRLFDRYEKDGKVSLAFSLVFQSNERTLTEAEIAPIMERITEALEKHDGWKVR